jgi:hypothetical protein
MKTVNLLIVITAMAIVVGFYWYEYRPAKIRKLCNAKAVHSATDLTRKIRDEREGLNGKPMNDPLLISGVMSPDDVFNKIYIDTYTKCIRENGLME